MPDLDASSSKRLTVKRTSAEFHYLSCIQGGALEAILETNS